MKLIFAILACFLTLIASAQQTLDISVRNPLSHDRYDEPVVLRLSQYGTVSSALVTSADGEEIACQLDDLDLDEQMDELCFLCNLKGKETRTFHVTLYAEGEPRPYPARVYAEMLMRNDKVKEKNRHDNYISSITARGDCANSYNLISTSVRRLTCMENSRNAWSYRQHSSTPLTNRRSKPTATTCSGWDRPSVSGPSADGMARSQR